MNGMIQLVVGEGTRRNMLSLVPWDHDNTLAEGQRGHHVTLAFKPDDVTAERLVAAYGGDDVLFEAEEVRADDRICALFGRLRVGGVLEQELRHITLSGTVPPRVSSELTDTAPYQEPIVGRSRLKLNVVQF